LPSKLLNSMLLNQPLSSHQAQYAEIAIADLGDFQIVIPTTNRSAQSTPLTQGLSISQREYSTAGWVVHKDHLVGTLAHLEMGASGDDGGVLKPIRRLGAGVPVAFEVWSRRPLPRCVRVHAVLTCEFRNEPYPYCGVFRGCLPKFVKIYATEGAPRYDSLLKVRQLLIDEAEFIAQNRDRLKHVPFYQKQFNL